MAITSVHTQEEQARRRRAERMGQQEAPALERAEGAAPVLSTASFPGLGPRRAAPDDSPYARGQRFATGGNRLKGRHDLVPGEATSLTVTWFVPPNGRLDPGDGTDVVEVGPLGGEVVHVYDDPPAGTVQYIVEARCFDPYDRLIDDNNPLGLAVWQRKFARADRAAGHCANVLSGFGSRRVR